MSAGSLPLPANLLEQQRAVIEECVLKMVPVLVDAIMAGLTPRNGAAGGTGPAGEKILSRGRLKWLAGCNTVWLDDEPCDLRKWRKARACLQLLIERQAFSEDAALHLVDEIDPYVREQSGLPPAPHSIAKLQDYFKDGGRLRDLCKEIVKPVAGDGRYFLKVD